MSIGFPLAPAETGLSSVIPSQFQVRFRTRRCNGVSSDSVPLYWVETINIADFIPTDLPLGIVGKGMFVAKSDALALMNVGVGTPTNVTALHALALQMAKDFTLWRTVSHDITFNGTIASPPNGIMDTCEWTLLSDQISTRQITQSLNGEPEEFNHNDPANAGCNDMTSQIVTTKTPCTEVYIPLWESVVGGPSPLGAYRSQMCLYDGRLEENFSFEDVLTCGCSGGNPCLTGIIVNIVTCNPSQSNGVLVVIKDQHGTTVASGTTFGIIPGTIVFLNFPCDNTATYTITISKTGFTTITQTLPVVCCISNTFMFNFLANPLPMITVNFHVASCESGEYDAACDICISTNSQPGIAGVTVGVTVNGSLISCPTNANGDCTITFPVNSNGAVYPVSATGGACVQPYAGGASITDTCLTQTIPLCIVLPADPTCHCFCCQNPRPATLFLTDSVYGATPLAWTLCADGAFRYTSTITTAFVGECGCPAQAVDITYFLECACNAGNTLYRFFACFTQYKLIEVCGGIFATLNCPGPIDPINPGTLCIPFGGNAACPTAVVGEKGTMPLFNNRLQNTTFKCAVPFNVLFTFPATGCSAGGGGGGPCLWHGIVCPTPWPDGGTFTVTQ